MSGACNNLINSLCELCSIYFFTLNYLCLFIVRRFRCLEEKKKQKKKAFSSVIKLLMIYKISIARKGPNYLLST